MRKRRVIVYEDDAIMQDLYRIFLVSLNYEVFTFSEPRMCPLYAGTTDRCRNEYPCADALIVDYFMPRMNGIELILKQSELGCKLTPRNKALISGDVDRSRIQPLVHLGCAYFEKPYPLSELAVWINSCERRMDITTPLALVRKEPRIPFTKEILCSIRRMADPIRGFGVNISKSGLCLKLPLRLTNQETVGLPPDLPFVSGSGLVRWSKLLDDGLYLTGLQCA